MSPLTDRHFKGQHYVALGSIPTTQNQEVDLLSVAPHRTGHQLDVKCSPVCAPTKLSRALCVSLALWLCNLCLSLLSRGKFITSVFYRGNNKTELTTSHWISPQYKTDFYVFTHFCEFPFKVSLKTSQTLDKYV